MIGAVLLLSLWVWLVALVLYFGIALCVVISRGSQGGASDPLAFDQASTLG